MGPQEAAAAAAPSSASSRLGRPSILGAEEEEDDEDDEAFTSFMQQGRHMSMGGRGGIGMGMGMGRRGAEQSRTRIMQTYVNARKCATISSDKR